MALSESMVLRGQLAKILGKGVEYSDEAFEVASLAGLLSRLGKAGDLVGRTQVWRDGAGKRLLVEALEQLDEQELFEEFLSACSKSSSESSIEDALFEWDEVIVAVWWAGDHSLAQKMDQQMSRFIESEPTVFQPFTDYARELLAQFGSEVDPQSFSFWQKISQL